MKGALYPLARQVYQFITPLQLIQETEASLQARQTTIELANNLVIGFLEQYGGITKPRGQKACVQATGSGCVQLADQLHTYIDSVNQLPLPKTVQQNCIVFYRSLQEPLLQLLHFLQTQLYHHCNPEQKLPDCQWLFVQSYFLQNIRQLETRSANSGQPQLVSLLLDQAKKYTQPGSNCCLTQGAYTYWKTLFQTLSEIDICDHTLLLETLILYNFNDGRFIRYVMENYCREMTDNENTGSPITIWYKWFHLVNCLHPVSPSALFTRAPHCKQLLLTAIKAEWKLYKKQAVGGVAPTQQAPAVKPFETTLSVAQLGVFLRLQVDANILQTNNISAFIRQVAEQCSTTRTPHISAENLHKKFYTCDPASVSIMRTHLSNMLNCLKKY